MNKLQKRERILLIILATAMLVVLPYIYVTKELITKHDTITVELIALEKKKQGYEEKQANMENIKEKLSSLKKEVLKMKIDSGNIQKTYETHYILTNLAAKNNVKLIGLSIADPSLIEMETGAVAPTGAGEGSLRKPMKMDVVLSLKGNLASLMTLVDDIEAISKNFVVESFISGDLSIENDVSVQLSLGIYMALSDEERIQISGT